MDDKMREAFDAWLRDTAPPDVPATDAWDELDCGRTGLMFRAAIEDAFAGGYKSTLAAKEAPDA